jgi:hypothetical protein
MSAPRRSIRDLLWLTLVVAMAVGWWLDHRSAKSRWTISDDGSTVTVRDTQTGRRLSFSSNIFDSPQILTGKLLLGPEPEPK